jgi:hypothetical protein
MSATVGAPVGVLAGVGVGAPVLVPAGGGASEFVAGVTAGGGVTREGAFVPPEHAASSETASGSAEIRRSFRRLT